MTRALQLEQVLQRRRREVDVERPGAPGITGPSKVKGGKKAKVKFKMPKLPKGTYFWDVILKPSGADLPDNNTALGGKVKVK